MSGTKIPHSRRKMPSVKKAKALSLNTRKSGRTALKEVIFFLGSLLLTRRLAMTSRKIRINPRILVAHAKPSMGKSLCSMSGKMIPPILPEVIAIPVALPRLTKKKCPIDAIHGVLMRAPPKPLRTP